MLVENNSSITSTAEYTKSCPNRIAHALRERGTILSGYASSERKSLTMQDRQNRQVFHMPYMFHMVKQQDIREKVNKS